VILLCRRREEKVEAQKVPMEVLLSSSSPQKNGDQKIGIG
jgi:hypothetical protein